MRVSVAFVFLAAITAGLVGYWLAPGQEPVTGPVASSPAMAGSASLSADAGLEELRQALEAETTARKALAQELAEMRKQLAGLSAQASAADAAMEETASRSPSARAGNGGSEAAWFNAQALLDAGIDTATADQIKQSFESLEMEKLYLRDRASREGWLRSSRFVEEIRKLNASNGNIRELYGEEAYDAFLYATGAANRVKVDSVLGSAPAEQAGIQAGDHILRYDNQRIYTGSDLRDATARGQPEEVVTVEVQRADQVLQFYLPRGPLGIRMSSISVAP